MLIAPIYVAAIAFEQPVGTPHVLSLENASLAELMSVPAAWEIVLKHLPSLKLMTSTPMITPHLRNMTVPSLSAFMPNAKPDVYAAVDLELSRLPPVEDPLR
jgi:hypothetical protein